MKYYIGIDLGGTNIVAGVVDENFSLIATASNKTNAGRPADQIVETMAQTAAQAAEKAGISMEQIESVGIGSPGIVDSQKREVIFASNLDFYNAPIGQLLEDRLHRPVFLANDADAAAYGEFMAGAGKTENGQHISNMVAITLGTGVGSGIIINSKIYNGYGFAGGEFGHTVICLNGRPCSCGRKGCIETYCSATGLITTTKEHMQSNPDSLMWKLCDGDLDKLSDAHLCAVCSKAVKAEAIHITADWSEQIFALFGDTTAQTDDFWLESIDCIDNCFSKCIGVFFHSSLLFRCSKS